MVVIKNGLLVTGDGKTVISNGEVLFDGDTIVDLGETVAAKENDEVIDASGCIVMPGLVNHHVHGVTLGPLFPSAAKPLPKEKVVYHQEKHLLQGTTTVLNVDGFATMEEVNEANTFSALHIQTCTSHTPLNFKAALAVDGAGFKEAHLQTTVQEMLDKGAVMVGEIGGGHTLGGGGQDYLYIPLAIEKKTGKKLEPVQARKLKVAVLGSHISLSNYDPDKVAQAIQEVGLQGLITVEEVKQTICDCVLPSIQIGLDAFTEAAQEGTRYGKPSLYHNSAPSVERMIEISEKYPYIIAAHSNHPSFEVEEAIEAARACRNAGALIDIATIDCFGAKKLNDSVESFLRFYEEDLVDMISTDYAAGLWDSPLCALDLVVKAGKCSLAKAVATATGNVVRYIPGLAPNAGVLAVGKDADIILVNKDNMADVKRVIVSGKTVVENGKIIK